MIATVVDTGALLKSVVAGLVSGIGFTLIFTIALFGASRLIDSSRGGRSGAAIAYGALAVFGLVAFAAAVTFGIIVMANK